MDKYGWLLQYGMRSLCNDRKAEAIRHAGAKGSPLITPAFIGGWEGCAGGGVPKVLLILGIFEFKHPLRGLGFRVSGPGPEPLQSGGAVGY
jgi:hypothetical protein